MHDNIHVYTLRVGSLHSLARAPKMSGISAARTISSFYLAALPDTGALYHPLGAAANENGSSHSTKGNAFEETSRLLRKNHLPRIHLFFCRTATFLRLQR